MMKRWLSSLSRRTVKTQPKKLDFGCGPEPKSGYVGVDIRKMPGVEYVCNAWEINRYVQEASITNIYSRHFFEHLTFQQADITLQAWYDVLVPEGSIQLILPDIQYHIEQFINPNPAERSAANSEWTVLEHAIAGFWGWQREGQTKTWDVHKSGYNLSLLKEKLIQNGFCGIERLPDEPWNLNVVCRKS